MICKTASTRIHPDQDLIATEINNVNFVLWYSRLQYIKYIMYIFERRYLEVDCTGVCGVLASAHLEIV